MRSKFLVISLIALSLISISLLSNEVVASTVFEIDAPLDYKASADNQSSSLEMVSTIFYLKAGNKLCPIGRFNKDTAGSAKCPNGYKQTGLFGFGILPIGTTEWEDVGTWKTAALLTDISLSGSAGFAMVLNNTGTTDITGAAMEFTLKDGGKVIAGPVVAGNITISANKVIVTTPVFAKINVTSISEGKSMSVYIRCKYSSGKNGGDTLVMMFGAQEYASHTGLPTNSVKITDVSVSKNLVDVDFTDAFGFDWTTSDHFSLTINNNLYNSSTATVTKEDDINCKYCLTWPVDLKTGTNNITVMLWYVTTPGWSQSRNVDIPAEGKTGGFLAGFESVAIITGGVIALIVLRTTSTSKKHRS